MLRIRSLGVLGQAALPQPGAYKKCIALRICRVTVCYPRPKLRITFHVPISFPGSTKVSSPTHPHKDDYLLPLRPVAATDLRNRIMTAQNTVKGIVPCHPI